MEKFTRIENPSVLARRWQVLLWVLALTALSMTFLGYGQVELLIQWVTARLC